MARRFPCGQKLCRRMECTTGWEEICIMPGMRSSLRRGCLGKSKLLLKAPSRYPFLSGVADSELSGAGNGIIIVLIFNQ